MQPTDTVQTCGSPKYPTSHEQTSYRNMYITWSTESHVAIISSVTIGTGTKGAAWGVRNSCPDLTFPSNAHMSLKSTVYFYHVSNGFPAVEGVRNHARADRLDPASRSQYHPSVGTVSASGNAGVGKWHLDKRLQLQLQRPSQCGTRLDRKGDHV